MSTKSSEEFIQKAEGETFDIATMNLAISIMEQYPLADEIKDKSPEEIRRVLAEEIYKICSILKRGRRRTGF